jgi:hypothetical protein
MIQGPSDARRVLMEGRPVMKTVCWSRIVLIAVLAATFFAGTAAAAGTGNSPAVADTGMASQKAYLTWKAAERESGMIASIEYINGLNRTNATTLNGLLVKYQGLEGQTARLSTYTGLMNQLAEMNKVNKAFRQELRNQMEAGRGATARLNRDVDDMVAWNKRLPVLESAYWTARMGDEQANFDTQVQRAAEVLSNLKAEGYDTTDASYKLDEIGGMRSDLRQALNARDPAEIRAAQQQIVVLSKELVQIAKDLQVEGSQDRQVRFHILEGNRAVLRAETINASLQSRNISLLKAVQYTAAAKTDLAAAQAALDAKNTDAAKVSLRAVRQDLTSLAKAYQDSAGQYRTDASQSSSLRATAQSFAASVASMGAVP